MIPFKNQQYPALISVRSREEELVCQVRYVSKNLPFILCGDTLQYSPTEGLKQKPNYPPEFVQCINQAIAIHINPKAL